MRIDPEILNAIEVLSKKVSRRHWSEGVDDLMQDGIVLVLELYKKKPHADKEWILKALHNFYASKRKKLRRYESRRVEEDSVPEQSTMDMPNEELSDVELEMIEFLANEGMSREEIIETLSTASRTLYTKLRGLRK